VGPNVLRMPKQVKKSNSQQVTGVLFASLILVAVLNLLHSVQNYHDNHTTLATIVSSQPVVNNCKTSSRIASVVLAERTNKDKDIAAFADHSISPWYSVNGPKNSSTYAWIGNQWIPPKGVPIYGPDDIRQTFERSNVLFFGDSISRQVYTTLWNIMYDAPVLNNKKEVTMDAVLVNADIRIEDLNSEVNINKMEKKKSKSTIDGTSSSKSLNQITEICSRGLKNKTSLEYAFQRTFDSLRTKSYRRAFLCRKTRSWTKFDNFWTANCVFHTQHLEPLEWTEAQSRIQHSSATSATLPATKLSDTYDVIIVQHGIWEIMQRWNCQKLGGSSMTKEMDMLESLSSAQRMASVTLKFIWVTIGPSEIHDDYNNTLAYNTVIRDWFKEQEPKHMYLLDFERMVLPRSLGSARIKGDLPPHWGVEARTLNAQMLTHALNVIYNS